MTGGILTEAKACRLCGSGDLRPVMDLGRQYIASIFVGDDVPDHLRRTYPLECVRCVGDCGLVQLRHSISPKVLYSHYGSESPALFRVASGPEERVEVEGGA